MKLASLLGQFIKDEQMTLFLGSCIPLESGVEFLCTFLCRFNDRRELLWKDLRAIARDCKGSWIVLGDK